MTNKTILRALLLLIMLTVSPITLVAQNAED